MCCGEKSQLCTEEAKKRSRCALLNRTLNSHIWRKFFGAHLIKKSALADLTGLFQGEKEEEEQKNVNEHKKV
jgi:hypothetical protein